MEDIVVVPHVVHHVKLPDALVALNFIVVFSLVDVVMAVCDTCFIVTDDELEDIERKFGKNIRFVRIERE